MYVHTRSSHDPSSKVKASYSGRSATMEVVAALGAAACCCACVLGICMLSSRCNCNQLCQARRRRNELLSECHYNRYIFQKRPTCQNETCPICLEDFRPRSPVVITPCKHGFHKKCLISCLEASPLCPFCKTIVGPSVSIPVSNHHIDNDIATERDPLIF